MKYSLAITCLLAPSSQALKLRNFALMAESTRSNASLNDATLMKTGLCQEYKWLRGAGTLESCQSLVKSNCPSNTYFAYGTSCSCCTNNDTALTSFWNSKVRSIYQVSEDPAITKARIEFNKAAGEDGIVSELEAMAALGDKFSEEVFHSSDLDGDYMISFEEYLTALNAAAAAAAEDPAITNARIEFMKAAGEDGLVSELEAMEALGDEFSETVFHSADVNGNGMISFEEYLTALNAAAAIADIEALLAADAIAAEAQQAIDMQVLADAIAAQLAIDEAALQAVLDAAAAAPNTDDYVLQLSGQECKDGTEWTRSIQEVSECSTWVQDKCPGKQYFTWRQDIKFCECCRDNDKALKNSEKQNAEIYKVVPKEPEGPVCDPNGPYKSCQTYQTFKTGYACPKKWQTMYQGKLYCTQMDCCEGDNREE